MATLFFDGFDRGTVLGRLDTKYWSTQYKTDPGYGFGSYSYDHNTNGYSSTYKAISLNNGIAPPSNFAIDVPANYNLYSNYYSSIDYGTQTVLIVWAGNTYPGFGSPPGFLSISNIPINDVNFLAPLTYIQLSGFPAPQGNKTYIGARFLGLETKHVDYDSRIDPMRFDKDGRFDYRHPLMAFCSGNTTGLLISVVKATGNNLQLLENQRMTMGLQVEQHGQILGTFDLNMNDSINNYKLSSVYNNKIIPQYSPAPSLLDPNLTGKVLTLCKSDVVQPSIAHIGGSVALCSRWCRLEFLISTENNNQYLAAQMEGIDVPVIDSDDTNSDKSTWNTEIPISGFSYNNIRIFNRTYYSGLTTDVAPPSIHSTSPNGFIRPAVFNSGTYYMKGAATLIDDFTIIDNIGQPGFWLGADSKVVPLSPGIDKNITDNAVILDGPREWTTNASSQRAALKNYDGDNGVLESSVSGAISAIRFDNHDFSADGASSWRTYFNDGIAGIKVYNTARKNFLDTKFTNVVFTGVSDKDIQYTNLLIKTDRDIYDATNKTSLAKLSPVSLDYGIKKFNDPSILFPTTDSYLYTTSGYRSLYSVDSSSSIPYPPPENFFTIESWVYFANGSENITLYGKKPPISYPQISDFRLDIPSTNFDIICTTGYIQYNTYIDDILLGYRKLYFPTPIPTGSWNHVALVNDALEDFRGTLNNGSRYYNHKYRLIAYMNGASGSLFESWNSLDSDLSVYTTENNPYQWSPLTNSYSNTINLDFGIGASGFNILSSAEPSLSGLGNNLSPLSGIFDEYFPTIKVPTNSAWIDMSVVPTSIVLTHPTDSWGNFYASPSISGNYSIKGFYNTKPYWQKEGTSNSIYWGREAEYCPYYWTVNRNLGGSYSSDIAGQYINNTAIPPVGSVFAIRGTYCWSPGSNSPISLQYDIVQPTPLSISETRCNNKLAYLVTSASSPDITGLYCYGGIYRNAYYYVNTNNSIYYLCNTDEIYGADNNASRRWVISSGLFNPTGWNIKYMTDGPSASSDTIFSIMSVAEGHAKININLQNNSNSLFTLYKNNIPQYNLSGNANGILSGIIPVASGDNLSLTSVYNYTSAPNLSTGAASTTLSVSLGSPVQNGLYYLPTQWISIGSNYMTQPISIVSKFLDDYTSTTTSNNRFPLFIGGGGRIDNYRLTLGTNRTQGVQARTRYWNNFTPTNEPFPSVYTDYAPVGPIHNLTRTRYDTIQYFSMNNPATQQPWTTGLVANSGFLLGIKKL